MNQNDLGELYKQLIVRQVDIVENLSSIQAPDYYSDFQHIPELQEFIKDCYKFGYDYQEILDLIFDKEFLRVLENSVGGCRRVDIFNFYGIIRDEIYPPLFQ